jgi:small subunit ribosomal protein S20
VAHHRSAKKRIRQTEKRTAINRSRMSRIKTFVRKVESAIANGDPAAAQAAFAAAEPEIRRGVTKGVLHLNTASRRISRLAKRVRALSGATAAAPAI